MTISHLDHSDEMATEAYQKVICMVDRTVNDAGLLLQQLHAREPEKQSDDNKETRVEFGIQSESCKTAPSYSTSTSRSAHTPPYSGQRKSSLKKRRSSEVPDIRLLSKDGGEVKIMHADNVYISCGSDGESVMLSDSSKASKKRRHRVIHIDSPSREIPLKKKPADEAAQQEADKSSQVVKFDENSSETVKFDSSAVQPKMKGKKLKPKSVTPKSKTSSSTSSSKTKSYLKETVTRTVITTTKEFPEGSDTNDPTKGVVKKREVNTTTTTNIYPEEKPMGPLPIVKTTERTFTTKVESPPKPTAKPVEPFSKYILSKYDKEKSTSSSERRPQNEVCCDLGPVLRTAMENRLRSYVKPGPPQPKDPYRPKKVAKFHVERAPKIERSSESSRSDKAVKGKKVRAKKKEQESGGGDESTESSKSAKPKKAKTPKRTVPAGISPPKDSPRNLPPWGVPSAEVPIEVELPKKERKAPSPPSTLQYTSSQSSLLGRAIHRKTPPSGKRHKKKKKLEPFVEATKSESYLNQRLQYAIAGRKIGKKQESHRAKDEMYEAEIKNITESRTNIKESRKAMKRHDEKKRAETLYTNPVAPKYLKPKYDIPDEYKVKREEESSDSSKSAKAAKWKAKKKSAKRKSESSSTTESIKTARSSTPKDSPRNLPPWGVPSAEVPIEVELPLKEKKAPSPPSTLQYTSSHSSLLGRAIHRKTPPSGKRHKKKKKQEDFVEAGKSESYLDQRLKYAIAGRKIGKKQIRQARENIRESRKAMKEQDVEKRSTKKYTNPVSPRYLKPKYKIPDELKVKRDSSEGTGAESTKSTKTDSTSAKEERTPISSTKSDGIVYASKKSTRKTTKSTLTKKEKKKKEIVERKMPSPERSESYLNIVSPYAIAGRKVKRKPAQRVGTLDQIRQKRENIKQSRETMKQFDAGKVLAKEFTTNPGQTPHISNIMKKQEEVAGHLEKGPKQGDFLPPVVDAESRTALIDHSTGPPSALPQMGKPYRRRERVRIIHKSHKPLRRKLKKRNGFRPAGKSESWLEHSLKFAIEGEKARKKKAEEDNTRNGSSEKSSTFRTDQTGSNEAIEPKLNKKSTSAEGISKPESMDASKSEKSSRKSKSKFTKMTSSSTSGEESPSKRGFKKSAKKLKKAKLKQERNRDADLGTARAVTPKTRTSSSSRSMGRRIASLCTPSASSLKVESESLKTPSVGVSTACHSDSRMLAEAGVEAHERAICRKCEKCNTTITPSTLNTAQESPLALTSAGPSDITSAPVDPRLLTPRGSELNLSKTIPIGRPAKSETKTAMEPNKSYPTCRCGLDPYTSRQFPPAALRNDIRFDAKFQIRDVDTNLEHTIVINGYFLDKNLMRLTLNGKFCRI
ncbi:hypothetical protein Y032_0005g2586 [Ancylostoma ceylanicum]|uniref:Uncharacterized protein n=1 Tax=Ancylostoma ceylanicum TaxID=53326 RepID=A0A016VU91_9BILA|nr:hypothetical protein Y032_0005g2586 [Ancylostoma ceylanicum]